MVAGVGLVLCSPSVKLPGFGLQFLLPGLRPPRLPKEIKGSREWEEESISPQTAILKYMLNDAMSGLKLARWQEIRPGSLLIVSRMDPNILALSVVRKAKTE